MRNVHPPSDVRRRKTKLTEDQVRRIRIMSRSSKDDKWIAELFKVSPKTIRDIRQHRTWFGII